MLKNNGKLATKLFNGKKIGVIEVGAAPDIVITKYRNPTPMNRYNIPWHLMFGVQPGCAWYTICQGKVLVQEGNVISMNPKQVQKDAQKETPNVWGRLEGIIASDKKKNEWVNLSFHVFPYFISDLENVYNSTSSGMNKTMDLDFREQK